MLFKKATDYLHDAELCRRNAEAATDPADRTRWLCLAEGWEHLAMTTSLRASPGGSPDQGSNTGRAKPASAELWVATAPPPQA